MNALIPTTAVDELRMQLRGSLLTPASPDYDDVRSIWNGMIDRRPALIVRALGTADIIATVRAARALELPLSIRGGGHNIAGLAVCDDGLMLDLSLMRGVWVDPDRRIARVQPGALLGDVDRETQLHGLAAVLGFVSATGVAGLTLGGGFGYLSRLHGWSSDSLRAVDLVTADGRIVRASDDDNADLLWGLRGGGGNFGVATGLEFDLFPLGPEIVAGAIAWPIERAGDVFALVRHMAEHGPREQSFATPNRLRCRIRRFTAAAEPFTAEKEASWFSAPSRKAPEPTAGSRIRRPCRARRAATSPLARRRSASACGHANRADTWAAIPWPKSSRTRVVGV
jgi:FAD/FMN-containing dehydrogenase